VRIAFVSIPRFFCAVEEQRRPGVAGQPLIVGDSEVPKRVLDCSQSASAKRVRRGMTVRLALGECPEAAIIPPDPVLYRARWESILDALGGLSPEVEDEGHGHAYINVTGFKSHYRDERALADQIIESVRIASGLESGIGLANGKFPACAAASCSEPGQSKIVPAGEEGSFLAPLNVRLLPVESEVIDRLRLFGLETLSELAALSVPELQSQFGLSGERLWQLACGIDDQPLNPRRCSEVLQASVRLDSPIAGIDVLIAISRQLLSRLKPGLMGRAARELTLQAELTSGRGWEHRLVFREPVSEGERLTFLLRSALTNFPPPNAVQSLSLRLGGLTGEVGKQLSLDRKRTLQRQVEEAIRQLKARYGHSPVYRCVDVESWSVIPEQRQILVESDA
jgi:DNA polymerase IV